MKTKIFKTLLIASMLVGSAWAKTVEFVVAWPPGGTTDQVAQVILTHAKPEFAKHGMTLVVSYRPGVSSVLGTNSVAKTPPGTMQLLIAGNQIITSDILNPGVATYDVARDFVLLGYIGHMPMLTVANSASGIKNVRDWQTACQARSLNYATAGVGSNLHISSALMSTMLGCKSVAIPYKGSAAALADLLGGHVDYLSDYVAGVLPHIESGKLVPLVVLDKARLPEFPQVPTIHELGLPDYNFYNWFTVVSNSAANPADIAVAQKIFLQVISSSEVIRQLSKVGVRGQKTVPADFMSQERRHFLQILQRVNFK
jgi:tripartite-type tricarboxylate transporter receptor subunit TctC